MSILIATSNPAKFQRYRQILTRFPALEIHSPQDLGLILSVAETGATAAANARMKAEAYAAASGLPTLGVDEALFLPALPPEDQPGVIVRRRGGKTLTDEELLDTFLAVSRCLSPNQRAVRWLYAVCLARPDGCVFTVETGWSGWLADQPILPYLPGYPLSSILLDETRKPLRLLTEEERLQREQPLADAVTNLIYAAGLG